MSTATNWETLRADIANRMRTQFGPTPGSGVLADVQVRDTEEDADNAPIAYPAAVVLFGGASRTSGPQGAFSVSKMYAEARFDVIYYTSEGAPQGVTTSVLALAVLGRQFLNGKTPSGQYDNVQPLAWVSDQPAEKYGGRGDGNDGAKLKQSYTLFHVIFGDVT